MPGPDQSKPPDSSKPSASKPSASKPSASKPPDSRPSVSRPAASRPSASSKRSIARPSALLRPSEDHSHAGRNSYDSHEHSHSHPDHPRPSVIHPPPRHSQSHSADSHRAPPRRSEDHSVDSHSHYAPPRHSQSHSADPHHPPPRHSIHSADPHHPHRRSSVSHQGRSSVAPSRKSTQRRDSHSSVESEGTRRNSNRFGDEPEHEHVPRQRSRASKARSKAFPKRVPPAEKEIESSESKTKIGSDDSNSESKAQSGSKLLNIVASATEGIKQGIQAGLKGTFKPPERHLYYEDDEKSSGELEQERAEEHEEHQQEQEHHKKHQHQHEAIKLVNKKINLLNVLEFPETLIEGEERPLSSRLDDAFGPCKGFMLCLFRFPLHLKVQQNFTREYTYVWKSFRGWMFFITGAIIIANCLLIATGMGAVMLHFPRQPESHNVTWRAVDSQRRITNNRQIRHKPQQQLRIEELFLLQRNFVPMILLLLTLVHIAAGDVSLFIRRKFIAKYFTFWDEAVEIMKMDVGVYPENVRRYLLEVIVFYAVYLLTLFSCSVAAIAPVSTGAPNQLAIFWGRLFNPAMHALQYVEVIRYVAAVVYLYFLICSKVYVLLLLYFCKILKNAFCIWNERLDMVLHKERGAKKTRKQLAETRTGFDHLFRDYVILMDLLRGADTMFANVIESYFGTQIFSVCFEIYYCIRTFSAPAEFQEARRLDAVIIGLYLFHTVIFLILTTNATASVGEAAMKGLEIIRRSGCNGRRSLEEMYFTQSMYMSYTGHFETALTGGRYVTFDRAFIVSLVGAIISYFIILSQFTPPLAMTDETRLARISPAEVIINSEFSRAIDVEGLQLQASSFHCPTSTERRLNYYYTLHFPSK